MAFDPYATLGLPRDADAKAIKRAYRRKAKAAHPDAGGSAEAFDELTRAVRLLEDPVRRARFDAEGATDAPPDPETEALTLLAALLEALFEQNETPERFDIVAKLREFLRAERDKIRARSDRLKRRIASADKARGRLGGWTPGEPGLGLEEYLRFFGAPATFR
jgi:curved DNA-binding protein CbpA